MSRACRECGESFDPCAGQQVRCNTCHWLMVPVLGRAHAAVSAAVKRGDLVNLRAEHVGCEDCGARATCYDHRDYSKPLDVAPVCHRCNLRRGPAAPALRNAA